MLSIDFVKISNSIYRQVNISVSRSISRFIDLAILGGVTNRVASIYSSCNNTFYYVSMTCLF